jgi:phage tail sheath protein FI
MPIEPPVSYPGVYIQEVERNVRTIVPVETSTTAFVGRALSGPVNQPVTIFSWPDFERVFGGLWLESRLGFAVNAFFLNGGSKAIIVRLFRPKAPQTGQPSPVLTGVAVNSAVGQEGDGEALTSVEFLGDQAKQTGIYALDRTDIFNLLVIPPYKAGDPDVDPQVLAAAVAYCQKRRAILLVDPPPGWVDVDKVKNDFPSVYPGLLTENAAIYFPRLWMPDPLRENQTAAFGPGGAIAGVIARTDLTRGVWKAPAGSEATLRGVVGLTVALTEAENGEMNRLGINCLRQLPAAGCVVWGARTMVGDDRLASQWKYLPVRRTALFIEESLYRGLQWAVFEPNDEPLWSALRLNITTFMHDLFRQGAFQGQTPRDAYFVRCDSTTTTQSDIDRGVVNIIVGFAPLKPGEFVILYIQQIAGQLAE